MEKEENFKDTIQTTMAPQPLQWFLPEIFIRENVERPGNNLVTSFQTTQEIPKEIQLIKFKLRPVSNFGSEIQELIDTLLHFYKFNEE